MPQRERDPFDHFDAEAHAAGEGPPLHGRRLRLAWRRAGLRSGRLGAQYGSITLINVNSANAGDDLSAVFTNNPGKGNGQGGSCYGDSGGPVFLEGTNQIAAIVSFGVTPCIGPDFHFRMDTELAHDFVDPFITSE